MKTLAQVYGTWDPVELQKYIIYHPSDFITKLKPLRNQGMNPLVVWEDAGVWLNCYDWNDPLIISISQYLDVVGVDFHAIMFTTPWPSHVIKKLRGFPDCITVKIIKVNDHAEKPRLARGYNMWMLPDLKRSGVKPIFEDRFNAIMPDMFYRWYKPYRKQFTDETYKNVESKLYGSIEQKEVK